MSTCKKTLFAILFLLLSAAAVYLWLRVPVFYDARCFPRLSLFQNNYEVIRNEAMRARRLLPVLDNIDRPRTTWSGTGAAEQFLNKMKVAGPGWVRAWNMNSNGANNNWLNFPLMVDGVAFEHNARQCPTLATLLDQQKEIINVAGLSLMMPRSHIATHTDTTGAQFGSLAYHLGLDVPPRGDSLCTLTVDDKEVRQKNGQTIVFDATYPHSADNKSDQERTILYIDFKTQ